jgi:hypothetical protein
VPAVASALLWASGCSSSPPTDPTTSTEPDPGSLPSAPGKGDAAIQPGFAVSGIRAWSLIGNTLTPGHDRLEVAVTAPADVRWVHLWLDDRKPLLLKRDGEDFRASVEIADLPAGEHRVLLNANGRKLAFAALDFTRSHPLYVFVSNDWDDPDNEDATLERQERLHAEHPELRLTHFVGPYTYTDPAVSAERAAHLTDWVKGQRDAHGDEIGLHIHPYCSFVSTTSVPCRTSPSFAKPYSDPSGYTVVLSSYTKDEMATLLRAADDIFEAQGLGKPTSFRAGGWTAELHTLEALAETGYVADASGANWSRMEEWKGVWGTSLYAWNQVHWSSIDDTSQPYHPSAADILSDAEPALSILELPDNGLLVDYVTSAEMIDVFRKNYSAEALAAPKMVSIGYHPPNFSESFLSRIDGALDEIDRHLASADEGPVVYATASELALVWSRAE